MKFEKIENVFDLEEDKKISYLKYVIEDGLYDVIEKFDLNENLLEYYKSDIDYIPEELKPVYKLKKYLSTIFYSMNDNTPIDFYYNFSKKNISIAERIQNKTLKQLVDTSLYKICSSLYVKTDLNLNHLETYYTIANNKFVIDQLFEYFDKINKTDLFLNLIDIIKKESNLGRFILKFKKEKPIIYVMESSKKILEP